MVAMFAAQQNYTLITMKFHINIVPSFHSYNMHPRMTHAHKCHLEMSMVYGHRIYVHLSVTGYPV